MAFETGPLKWGGLQVVVNCAWDDMSRLVRTVDIGIMSTLLYKKTNDV